MYEIFGFHTGLNKQEVSKTKMVVRETFKHPGKITSINLEPLPEEIVDQLLKEADELYAAKKSKIEELK